MSGVIPGFGTGTYGPPKDLLAKLKDPCTKVAVRYSVYHFRILSNHEQTLRSTREIKIPDTASDAVVDAVILECKN